MGDCAACLMGQCPYLQRHCVGRWVDWAAGGTELGFQLRAGTAFYVSEPSCVMTLACVGHTSVQSANGKKGDVLQWLVMGALLIERLSLAAALTGPSHWNFSLLPVGPI